MIACALCGQPVDPLARSTLQGSHAWEKKVGTRWTGTKGGSDMKGRRPLQEWAHELCVDRERDGISPNQDSLL